ncbi:MAG: hypothetical protein ACSLEN_00280 [Candidatus Malihini olakiniferum]
MARFAPQLNAFTLALTVKSVIGFFFCFSILHQYYQIES